MFDPKHFPSSVSKSVSVLLLLLLLLLFFGGKSNKFASDGRSRVGVYCAANACIEQVVQHGEVDVFQAVKNVRRHRPQLMENLVSRQ